MLYRAFHSIRCNQSLVGNGDSRLSVLIVIANRPMRDGHYWTIRGYRLDMEGRNVGRKEGRKEDRKEETEEGTGRKWNG